MKFYGKACKRNLNSGAGQIEVEAPRINDKRPEHKFNSTILPPYLRKSPNIESLLPVLYLKGLSGNDFPRALESILGEGAKGLSSSTIATLKKTWLTEFDVWQKRSITKEYVYIWADGVHVKVRLGEDKK